MKTEPRLFTVVGGVCLDEWGMKVGVTHYNDAVEPVWVKFFDDGLFSRAQSVIRKSDLKTVGEFVVQDESVRRD